VSERRYTTNHSEPSHWTEVSGQLQFSATLSLRNKPPPPSYPYTKRLGGSGASMDAVGQRKIFYPCLEFNYNSLFLVVKSRAAQIIQKWSQLKIFRHHKGDMLKTQTTGATIQNLAAMAT